MKKKRLSFVMYAVCIILFVSGISIGSIGRGICRIDNQNYTEIQSEMTLPDVISTVWMDEDLKQIYVCYDDADSVNVYTFEGEFLWCVSTPYIRNTYFELQEGKLIIYGEDAYIYNSKKGEFIGKEKAEDLQLGYEWENDQTANISAGELYFDSYQVYMADSDGEMITIVSRPWWHWLFNFGVCWFVSFVGAVGIGINIFIGKKREHDEVKERVVFKTQKAKIIAKYMKITSVVQTIFAVLDIVIACFGTFIGIGIIPIALHFIVSGWFIHNMIYSAASDEAEEKVLRYLHTVEWATMIIAFFSVIIAVGLAG